MPGNPRHRENGKWQKKKKLSGKTQGIWEFCQNTGNLVRKVVNSLILKVKDISVFAAKIPIFSEDLDKAFLCM